jgi:hypothetical protein
MFFKTKLHYIACYIALLGSLGVFLALPKSTWAANDDNSRFISQDIPTVMLANQSYTVSIIVENNGSNTWTKAAGYKLGSQNPADNSTWGVNRLYLDPTEAIAPGQQKTFTLTLIAPSTPGAYNFQWKMLQEGVNWFGEVTPNIIVHVNESTNSDAQFISQNVPTAMEANKLYIATVTLKNTGANTWIEKNDFKLGSQNPHDNRNFGYSRVHVEDDDAITTNQQKTFQFRLVAPSTPGVYNFQWRMLQEGVGWFGETTPNITIVVSPYTIPQLVKFDNINSKIGVTHIAGLYPQIGGDFLPFGAQTVRDLGFQTVEISLRPDDCETNVKYPQGRYQTLVWCNLQNLTEVASSSAYQQTLSKPFKTIIITSDAYNSASARSTMISDSQPFSQAALDSAYTEFLNLTKYLLQTYAGTNKTFILQTPNEMDFAMRPNRDIEPTDQAISNAIAYWNNIQRAVDDAKAATPPVNVQVYHGCEVNLVKKAIKGDKTAANNVLPNTHCDLYGYSSYDTGTDFNYPERFTEALQYLASKAPDSQAFGDKNIYISEFSVAEVYGVSYAVYITEEKVNQALEFGVPYFMHWQMFDNECTVYPNPTDADCPGFWIKKPSGAVAPVYESTYLKYQIDTTPPTVTITSPQNGATIARNTTVNITANATDLSGINKVEFYVNNILKCTDTSTPYSCAWSIPNPKGTTYSLVAKAYDIAGNIASSSTITVTSR